MCSIENGGLKTNVMCYLQWIFVFSKVERDALSIISGGREPKYQWRNCGGDRPEIQVIIGCLKIKCNIHE